MTFDCKAIKQKDPLAAELCEALSQELGGSMVPREPAEVYQAYARATTLKPDSKSARVFRKKFGTDLQWRISAAARPLVTSMVEHVASESNNAFGKANALLHRMKAPKSEAGLGLEYRDHTAPEADFDMAISRGYVRCSEFQTVFYGAGLMLGLEMYPLEVVQIDEEGNNIPHGAIMVVDKQTGEHFFADMQLNDVQRKPPYETYYVGTASDLFSAYLYNLSTRETDTGERSIAAEANIPLIAAESITPDNAFVLFGLGVHYQKRKMFKEAIRYYRRVTQVRPNDTPALRALCMLTFDKSICDKLPPK